MPRVLLAGLLLLAACHPAIEVTGLYVRGTHHGWFFPCNATTEYWQIRDSTLAARYSALATQPNERVFVRLTGVKSDSSGIYGPDGWGKYHFLVHRIVEMRTRGPGECASVLGVAAPIVTTAAALPVRRGH